MPEWEQALFCILAVAIRIPESTRGERSRAQKVREVVKNGPQLWLLELAAT